MHIVQDESIAALSSPVKTAEDRRARRRRPTRLPGWCYRGQTVQEVQMRNVSTSGAGFVSPERYRKGQPLHLKIGIGANRRPRPVQVMFCRERPDGRFDVGVRFEERLEAA